MVNLDDAPPPPPPDIRHSLTAGGRPLSPDFSTASESRRKIFSKSASRRRSLSETGSSVRVPDSSRRRFSSLSYSFSEKANGSNKRKPSRFYETPHTSSLSGPTMSPVTDDTDEEEKKEIDGAYDEAPRESVVTVDETRNRMYSETSYQTDVYDDDTMRDFVSKRRAPSTMDTAPRQKYLFGHPVPLWMTTKPKAKNVAACLAKYAPCFWCSRESLNMTTTNQAILLRLNALTAFFSLVQVASSSFLTFVLFNGNLLDRHAEYVSMGRGEVVNSPNMWSVNGGIISSGVLAVCVFIGMLCSRRGLRELSLPTSLRTLWFMLWIIPIQVYLFVSMFDYHGVTAVWVRHWWAAEATAWFRYKSCAPNTYNTLCVVPIDGLPFFDSANEWCDFYYNSTDCVSIRNAAQAKTTSWTLFYALMNGVLGVIVFLLLLLMVKVLEGIITRPIMQKSRERNIPMWLTLPMYGCAFTGAVLLYSPSSILKIDKGNLLKSWPGVVYLIAAALYAIAALLGFWMSRYSILNSRDKRAKLFIVLLFILVMTLTLLSVAALFVGCVLLSTSYVDNNMNDEIRGILACSISAGSCTFCDNDEGMPRCPQWSEDDVKAGTQDCMLS